MQKRRFRGFWLRRKRGERPQLFLSVLLGVGLAIFFIHRFDAALRPHLVALAEAQVRNRITHIADQAVTDALTEQSLSYADTVFLQPGQTGNVATFSTDTARLNLLRASILEDIVTQAESLDKHSLSIPFGALTGLDLLSGLGPDLPVRVLSVASAEGSYRSDLISAGINQTLHRLMLDVTVTVQLLLPGGVVETTVSTPVSIAETILVGDIPQTYLGLSPSQ